MTACTPSTDPAPKRVSAPSKPQLRRQGELACLPHVGRFEAANLAYAASFASGMAPVRINGTYYVQGAA